MKTLTRKMRSFRGVLTLVIVVQFSQSLVFANAGQHAAQKKVETKIEAGSPDARKLEAGKPVGREMKDGESHTYEVALEAGFFLNVVVAQLGVDVVVEVSAPDGGRAVEVDSPNETRGEEVVTLITEAVGG